MVNVDGCGDPYQLDETEIVITYENVLERIVNTQEKLSQPRAFYVCVGSGSRAHDARFPGHHIVMFFLMREISGYCVPFVEFHDFSDLADVAANVWAISAPKKEGAILKNASLEAEES